MVDQEIIVLTETLCRSQRREESSAPGIYNRVLVYDENLFPLLDRDTDERQLIYIKGELSYELHMIDALSLDDAGSFIIAHRIHYIRTDILNLL